MIQLGRKSPNMPRSLALALTYPDSCDRNGHSSPVLKFSNLTVREQFLSTKAKIPSAYATKLGTEL